MDWKVYDAEGRERARTVYAEDAAALVSLLGEGATIRVGGNAQALWTEGEERQPAGESYDHVRDVVHARRNARGRRPIGTGKARWGDEVVEVDLIERPARGNLVVRPRSGRDWGTMLSVPPEDFEAAATEEVVAGVVDTRDGVGVALVGPRARRGS